MKCKTVIVDLDGTLALNQHRFHYIDKAMVNKPDWNAYFEACDRDSPNIPVVECIRLLKETGYKIHIFSARGNIVKNKTILWLKRYKILYDYLTMREMDSYTPDDELKKRWLTEMYPNFNEEIFCIFDDRDKVVKMWRSLGLTCFQVAYGDF